LNFKVWFLAFSFSLFASMAGSADAIPTAEDINSLAEIAKLTADTFMQESLELRLRYEYSEKFLTQDDKKNLQKIAKRACNHLQTIAKSQQALKNKIEDYQGDDWDDRYGSTGLWRKLFTDVYTTTLSKCQIDFYLALTNEQPQQKNKLHKILAQIGSLETTYRSANSQLLKANVLTLLAQTDPAYKTLAIKQLDELNGQETVVDEIYITVEIEKIKFPGQTRPGQLDTLAEELAQSSCAGDLELALSLAFLRRRLNYPEALKQTVHIWPQTEGFLGSLILLDLSHRIAQGQLNKQALRQISVVEAELAVQATWENKAEDHKTLLDYFSNTEKFQTPLILYVTAVAFAESSPTKAVNLLVKASNLQQLQKSDKLNVKAERIAKQAAQLAYNLFAEDLTNCQLALTAFDNYCTMAGEKIDEELEYLYTIVLNNCGQVTKSKELLEKIADRPAGYWRNRARLDLIVLTIQQNQHENQSWRSELLKQLSNLISGCIGQDEDHYQLRAKAITIYCQLLLESKDKVSAQKVLNILDETKTASDPNLNVFKSKALRQLGRLDESAHYLLRAIIEPNFCELVGEAMELLSETVDRIDQAQEEVNEFPQMVQDCYKLAEFCYGCLDGTQNQQAGLFLAEISVFAANKKKDELLVVDKLLDNLANDADISDVDLLRCRARLLAEQDKFDEAAELWGKVAKMRKRDVLLTNQRSWKWWRAKFYELNCWAKQPQTEKGRLLHTVEILENSFTNIPPLWAEKLNSLKQEIK